MQVNALKNREGIFVNTQTLREEALHFLKYGRYCDDPWGSPAWHKYWTEQLNRCQNGYSSGGLRITGNHYGYLNFGQIKLTREFLDAAEAVASKNADRRPVRKGAAKIVTFPDFWDLDYNYFHVLDIARWGTTLEEYEALGLEVRIAPDYLNGGWHVIVGKSRRKGFSYKNGFLLANAYNTIRNSVSIVGAYLKEYMYPEGTMKMASDYVNFFNEHTGWAKAREYVDKINHKKASFSETDDNNITVEKGYKSTILALTFQNNPDAAIGKDGTLVLFEEAGMFPNLKESYTKTRPTLEDGKYTTGQAIIFGTGGDMESGTTDFADLFFHPKVNRLLPFDNIWSPNVAPNVKCGFYVPDYWCKPGYIDTDGNSDKEGAYEYEYEQRKDLKENGDSTDYQNYIQQYSFTPEESFLDVSNNDMPVVELRNQLNKVIAEDLFRKKAQPVYVYWDSELGKPAIKPDLRSELRPVNEFPPKDMDNTGCIVLYEAPIPNPPKGLYKAGYDPYRQDQSSGPSLGAFYIYKARNDFSFTGDTIVAEYVGRPNDFDTFNQNVMYLAMIYNLEIMHENEILEVKNYFRNKKRLHLLAAQPDAVISKNIKNSSVARIYGIHMVDRLKDAGLKYIKKWLLEVRDFDENGNKVLNLEKIYSPGLLRELISYDRKRGNFDRVMAFMMVMFQLQEEEEGKQYQQSSQTSTAKQLLELELFKR